MTTATLIKVNTSASFRQELAEKMIEQSHPAFHDQGKYYADPVEGRVYFSQNNALWEPWNDEVTVVSIDELFDPNHDYDPSIDWDLVELPYRDMVAAYLEDQDEEFEPNGDIPEWVKRDNVVEFCYDLEPFAEIIADAEKITHEESISWAKSCILEEIEIDSENY